VKEEGIYVFGGKN